MDTSRGRSARGALRRLVVAGASRSLPETRTAPDALHLSEMLVRSTLGPISSGYPSHTYRVSHMRGGGGSGPGPAELGLARFPRHRWQCAWPRYHRVYTLKSVRRSEDQSGRGSRRVTEDVVSVMRPVACSRSRAAPALAT